MHHFKAKGGTVFHFNSDLSGDARVMRPVVAGIRGPELRVPCADLLEFVDWWRSTPGYGKEETDEDPPGVLPSSVYAALAAESFDLTRDPSPMHISILGGSLCGIPKTELTRHHDWGSVVEERLFIPDMCAHCLSTWRMSRDAKAEEAASHPAAPEASSPDGSAPAGGGPR